MKRLATGEETIMIALWSSDDPLSISELQKLTPDYSRGSVAEIISNLIKKKVIDSSGVKMIGKSLTRVYKPQISEEYYSFIIPEKTLSLLATNFVTKNKTSGESKELYEMLKEVFNEEEDNW